MPLKPFNILYLSSFGSTGRGGQESLFHLVTNLDKRAYRPYVNLPTEGSLAERLRGENIRVTILDLPKVLTLRIHKALTASYMLFKLVSDYDIHLIHTDGPLNTFYAGLVARIKGLPLVWHVRASNRDRYDRLLYRVSSRLVLVANSLRSRFDWVHESHKFVTIHNGVDLSEFQTKKSKTRVRQEYGVGDKAVLIAVIARVEPLKGQKYLIEACGRIKDRLKDFHVLLIGEAVDLPYLKKCKERAAELGIQDRVTFTGYQSRVAEILKETDIFVLPSLFEALPRSLIEAMATGKPVVGTNVGGCLEAVEDSVSGFVVPARDEKALADRIHRLGTDSRLRLTMGRAARMRAEKMFSIKRNVKETQRLYQEILGEIHMTSAETTCNLCGLSEFKTLEHDQAPFKVLQCKNCSLVFVFPLPEGIALKGHYDDNYYREWLDTQKGARIKMWKRRLAKLQRFSHRGTLLDVGCGEGTFLQLAEKNGWRTRGTEVSSYAATYAASVSGADIFCGELPDAGYPESSFDVVTMWHVLEHVRDPKRYLEEIHRILKPNGLLVMAVPNLNDVVMQIAYRIIKRRKLRLFSKDEKEVHLYHFSERTVRAYLGMTGFECLRLSPDFGIIEPSKRLINMVSVIPYYLARVKIFNAIEVYAIPKKE